jgi:hypothetical protein
MSRQPKEKTNTNNPKKKKKEKTPMQMGPMWGKDEEPQPSAIAPSRIVMACACCKILDTLSIMRNKHQRD